MPSKYLQAFERALDNYKNQAAITHFSLSTGEKPKYKTDWFGWWRHGKKLYPAFALLQDKLKAATEEEAKSIIILHFSNKNNKWNSYSFNTYLLNELYRIETKEYWEENWKLFDKKPIAYYQGILFRGSGDDLDSCFTNGITEKTKSDFLDDYIKDMSGAIGISTSKSFSVAKGYALPSVNYHNLSSGISLHPSGAWSDSYIYVLNFSGNNGIDLVETFKARNDESSANYAQNKQEVNIIGSISPKDILGAFYVNRLGKIKWFRNPNSSEIDLDQLKALVPEKFYNELARTLDPSLAGQSTRLRSGKF